jgi:TolB protein
MPIHLILAASLGILGSSAPLHEPIHDREDPQELPTHQVPNIGSAAEFYFSPDSQSIIGNAKRDGDDGFRVYTLKIDGTEIRRINDRGDDACSFFFPNGKRLIWTSNRDHLDIPKGNYSDPADYPKGSEIYTSDLNGKHVRRLTNNLNYDAEVSLSPDGKKVLFGRNTDGKMDLWLMKPDGTNQRQLTHLEGLQPGGSFYLPDNHTIIFRAWKKTDEGKKGGLPMTLFTIQDDGTGLRQLTHDEGTNWAPFPAPDGRHYVFVKVISPRNYEIFLGDLQSDEQVRLTYNDAFDGYPSLSPDGHWLLFSSTRGAAPGSRSITLFLQDISSLNIGPKSKRSATTGKTKAKENS